VESQDDGSATDTAGFTYVANGLLHLLGSGVDNTAPGVSRTVDVSDADTATVNVGVLSGATALDASDVLTVRVTADGDPAKVVTQELSGDSGFPTVSDETSPPVASVVPVDVSALLPASSLTVSLLVDEGDATGNTSSAGQVFLIEDVSVDVSGVVTTSTSTTDGFEYDGAGRMTQRTVDGAVSALTWDPMSNLVATEGPVEAGGSRVYVYDASGQRVAQLQVSELSTDATAVAASVYVGDVQVDDADATVTGHVTGTRFVSFGGATVRRSRSPTGATPSGRCCSVTCRAPRK
jgi:hypothetical protein